MTRRANEVLRQALELSTPDRAALASSLIDSLDPEFEDAEQAWKDEITRRMKEPGSEDRAVTWEELHRRFAARLHDVR